MPSQVRGMTPEAIRALFKRRFDAQANDLKLKLSDYNDDVAAMKEAMDASLAALNEDVGSSIEKATAEAKKANDAIVALDAFDKAVSSQISGMLDQSKSAIAEANALLAQMPEFEKKTQDAIDKAEALSQSVANYKESQERLKTELLGNMDALSNQLNAQAARVGDAVASWHKKYEELETDLVEYVDSITKDLSGAIEEQLKVSPALAALSNKLDSTNDSLSKLNNDYKSVNDKVSDITGKVEPLSQQAKQAAENAQKAIEALRNPAYIGSSVLTVDQITGNPHWSKGAIVSDRKTPDRDSVWVHGKDYSPSKVDAPYVLVDSRIPYKVSFWARADGAGSLLSMKFKDENDYNPFASSNGTIPRRGWTFPYRITLDQNWKKYEATVQFNKSVEKVTLTDVYWNDTKVNPTQQYIGGFKFFPLIPDQATIDTLQNNAILKNTKIGTSNTNAIDAINAGMQAQATLNQKQQEWNAIQQIVNDNQQAWNKAQETVNQNQSKWNQAAKDYKKLNDRLWGEQGEINKLNQAIDANQTELLSVNTRAIKSLTNGANIIPYYTPSTAEVANGYSEWTRPCWAKTDFKRLQDDSVYKGFGYYHFDKATDALPDVYFTIDPSIEYDFEVWLRGTEGGVVFLEARDSNNEYVIVSGAIYGDEKPDTVSKNVGVNLIANKTTHPTWTKYKTRLKFTENVSKIKIHQIYANHPNGVQPATVDIGEDMRLYPHIPSQDDVNKALMDADKALQDQLKVNDEIDAAQTRADEGFYKAIKALSMPEEANSLLAFIEPSDAEIKAAYEAGKASYIVYDQPEWTLFGHATPYKNSNNASIEGIAGEWTASSENNEQDKTYPSGKASLKPIIKGISYKLSFWGYSRANKSRLYLTFYNQNGKACFSNSDGYIDGDKRGYLGRGSRGAFAEINVTLEEGYHKYEFRVDFTPDTTAVRLDRIGWHDSGTLYTQRIAGMRFVPDIPSQAEIDKAQNNAIINNSNAIAINNWSDKIQAIINRNQQKQIDYLKKFQDVAIKSQQMAMPRFMRINYEEGWSTESPDFDQFFDVTKDKNFWDAKVINFRMKGKHNGLLMVYSQYLKKALIDDVLTQMDTYAIVDGKQERRIDGKDTYYNNVYAKFPINIKMYAIVAVYYPRQLPNGTVPEFPSPPYLQTSFPSKPTLKELE